MFSFQKQSKPLLNILSMEPNMKTIKLIECPRDAMQGWERQIPTAQKIVYLKQLLEVGFDTLDFGSFVSPKAIPQMAETELVYRALEEHHSPTKLLAIIANLRGVEKAVSFEKIHYLGFPFSISETFQQRNTNISIQEAFKTVEAIQSLCLKNNKTSVVYFSMAFGNPYGDAYNTEIVAFWTKKMADIGINIIALSDTVGLADGAIISSLFKDLIAAYPAIEFGGHFHARAHAWLPKIKAAYEAGCTRFDGAIGGFGGCPMAEDELVGNINTQNLIEYFESQSIDLGIDLSAFNKAVQQSWEVFV